MDLYISIPAVDAHIFNCTTELVIPIGIPINDKKEENEKEEEKEEHIH